MQLKEFETKCIHEYIERDNKKNLETKTTTIEFPYTGKSKKKIEKRKRSFYEGENVINRKRLKSRYNIIESDQFCLISFLQVIITHLHDIDNTFV